MTESAPVPVSREGLTEEQLAEIEKSAKDARLRIDRLGRANIYSQSERLLSQLVDANDQLLSEVRRLTDINERLTGGIDRAINRLDEREKRDRGKGVLHPDPDSQEAAALRGAARGRREAIDLLTPLSLPVPDNKEQT